MTEKKQRKRKAFLTCFALFIAISFFGQSMEKEIYPFGINLAGAEFGSNMPGTYGHDYGYPSALDFRYVEKKGFALVRLPFKWERIQPDLNGNLDCEELKRLKSAVTEAGKCNIQIILDIHNYCRRNIGKDYHLIGKGELQINHLTDLWKKIAKEFKEYPNIYGYGLMNEPHDMLPSTPWFKMAQACISEIRKIDEKTTIIIAGNNWSSAAKWLEESDELKYLYDPADKLIFEAHLYFDKDCSGTYRYSYETEEANPYIGIERIQPFVKWLKDNNLKGFVGEYGIPDNDKRWLICLDNFLAYIQSKGINGTYWASGPRWGNYQLAVQPDNNYMTDRPQMKILQKYLYTNPVQTHIFSMTLDDKWKFHIGDSTVWAIQEYNDSKWEIISTNQYWEEQGYPDYDGYAWYRKTFIIPEKYQKDIEKADGLYIRYDYADDVEELFVNGNSVGRMGEFPPHLKVIYGKSRKFKIPAKFLNYGKDNLLAFRVYDGAGKGGILSQGMHLNTITAIDDLEFKVNIEEPDWTFNDDKNVKFEVFPANKTFEISQFQLICKITTDDYRPIDSLNYTIDYKTDKGFSKIISFTPPEPGFYRITLYGIKDGRKSDDLKFNIGYNPEKIISQTDMAPDFEDFWQKTLSDLKQINPHFKMSLIEDKEPSPKRIYHVEMYSLGNVKIEGYYAVPKQKGKYPAVIRFLGYGADANLPNSEDLPNYCEFVLSVRGQGIQKNNNPYGEWVTYGLNDKADYYYRGAYMDLIRGMDFLCSRPEVDNTKVFAEGGSQGGAFTLALCALDDRVCAAAPYIPALTDFRDYFKISPWKHEMFQTYLQNNPRHTWEDIYQTLSYFDIKNLVSKIKCPIIMGIGLQDNVCPPHINFASYNLIKSPKKYFIYPDKEHAVGDKWWDERNNLFFHYCK